MISELKYRVDNTGMVGVKAEARYRWKEATLPTDPRVCIEMFLPLNDAGGIVTPLELQGGTFMFTESTDLSKLYFPLRAVKFFGKAVVTLNSNFQYLSMSLSQANYPSLMVKSQGDKLGVLKVNWLPVTVGGIETAIIEGFCNKYLFE